MAYEDDLRHMLLRLTEKVERANGLQHSGTTIPPEDWSELYMLTNEARAMLGRALTAAQRSVIEDLHLRNCHMLAGATEEHWRKGERYYIDTRVSVPKSLRKRFEEAQKEFKS